MPEKYVGASLKVYISIFRLEIYDGYNYSGESFYVEGKRFDLGVNYPQKKISLQIEDLGGLVISNGSCSVIGNYSICLNNIEFGYHNYSTDTILYKANVVINVGPRHTS